MLREDEVNVMADIIVILKRIGRVARDLEADRKVTGSKSPRYLPDLNEKLHIMSGSVTTQNGNRRRPLIKRDSVDTKFGTNPRKPRDRIAETEKYRDASGCIRLVDPDACILALQLARNEEGLFGTLWNPISKRAAELRPQRRRRKPRLVREKRRQANSCWLHGPRPEFLFHFAAMMDVNECEWTF